MNNKLVVVLGMHRSGTSAVTRGLQVMGVSLGNSLLPAVEDNNAKGFSEDAELNALNITMLSLLGSDWHHLAPIESEDVEFLRKKGYLLRAVEMLRQKVASYAPFGFKDPRVAKLLPFWLEVFKHSRLDVSFVLVIRHPLSVAKSLAKRDGLAAEKSYLLWLGHVLSSLSGTQGGNRIIVDYDRMMHLPEYELDRMARCFDLSVNPAELSAYRTEFLDQGLRHTLYELQDLLIDGACPPIVQEVYAALHDVASEKASLDDFSFQSKTATWATEFRRLKSSLLLIDKLSLQCQLDQRVLAERESRLGSVGKALEEREALVGSLGQTIESLVIDRDSQKVGLQRLQAEFDKLATDRSEQVLKLSEALEFLVVDRDSQKASLQRLQAEFDQHAMDRAEQVQNSDKALELVAADRDSQVARLTELVAERGASVEGLVKTIESLIVDRDSRGALAQHYQELSESLRREKDDQVEKLRMELATVYRSKSWRLTSPLRWLIRKLYETSRTAHSSHPSVSANPSDLQLNVPANVADQVATTAPNQDVDFRILLVSHYCPTRAHAGGLRILDIYTLIGDQYPNVKLDILTFHRPTIDWSLGDIYNIFDNVYLSNTEDLTPAVLSEIRGSSARYDVIDLQFHQTGHQIDAFRQIGSKVIFTPMESLAKVAFSKSQTDGSTSNDSTLRKRIALIRSAAEEVIFSFKADKVVCVSRSDAAFLRAITSSRRVIGVDTGVSQLEFSDALAPGYVCKKSNERRRNILYVAYFGSETNIVALRWYLNHVHKIIKDRVPGYCLTVVGRGDLSVFDEYQDNTIEFIGEVPAIAPWIAEAGVCVAPALSGSGLRGKINQYSILGVPSVASTIAHKGLTYQDGRNIFVADEPELFANCCVRLLTDLELNNQMGQAARELCLANYSWQSKWPALREIYNLKQPEIQNAA